MSKNGEKEFFIHFDHPVFCSKGGCERHTSWGHAVYWDGDREIMLLPFCWEHGFALRDFVLTGEQLATEQIKEQNASVERFVVGYHGDKGTAKVIGPCDPKDVARFTPYGLEDYETPALYETWHMHDYAWYVRYELEGIWRYGYVLFVSTDWRFEWYEIGEGVYSVSGQ